MQDWLYQTRLYLTSFLHGRSLQLFGGLSWNVRSKLWCILLVYAYFLSEVLINTLMLLFIDGGEDFIQFSLLVQGLVQRLEEALNQLISIYN